MASAEPQHDAVVGDTAEASGKQTLIRFTPGPSPMARSGEMFRIYMATASCWFVGAVIQAIGIFASVTPQVYTKEVIGNCMGDVMDWMADFVGMLGLSFWFVGACLRMTEAANLTYDQQLHAWEAHGRQSLKPRFRWLGAAPRRLEWWAALSYLIGLILYYIGVVAIIINDCPYTPLSTLSYLWTVFYLALIGGWFFALGGALYVMADVSVWLYPGIFVPLRGEDARSLHWWGRWMYFWAGWLFVIGGMQLYWYSPIRTAESLGSFNALTGIGFGGGFILYAVGAALFMAQQARGRAPRAHPQYSTEMPPGIAGDKV